MNKVLQLFFLLVVLISCDSNRIYEEYREIEGAWPVNESAKFAFEILDTTSVYDLSVSIRNANRYQYNNLYIKYQLQKGSNVIDSDLAEFILFEPKTGRPLGSGLGDVFDHRFPLIERYTFDRAGMYQLDLTQFMRMDTLRNIERIGLRIELVDQE